MEGGIYCSLWKKCLNVWILIVCSDKWRGLEEIYDQDDCI